MRKDIRLTEDGDISIGPTGDIDLSYGDDCLIDQIRFRLLTQIGDNLLFPMMGADLETLIGLDNIQSTGTKAENLIRSALIHDQFLAESDINMLRAVPMDANTIAIFLTIKGLEGNIDLIIPIDLKAGKIDILSQ